MTKKEVADVIKHHYKGLNVRPWQMPEIKPSANKLGCFLLKGDFCFNFVPLIQFMANWQRF